VPLSWAQLMRGLLPRGGPWSRTPPRSSSLCQAGKEAFVSLPPEGADGELSSHSGYEDGSPADGGATARKLLPLRPMSCLSWGAADTSLRSVAHN
jgi:hypothetical protein